LPIKTLKKGGTPLEIRKLEYINVRDIWKNEASNFTVWLSENIDYLTEKLGFKLNVIETERKVGSFNVDIFCEDEQGNSVIIENQLEKTDHGHLGQILTYAVGTAAKTIIWISPEPREEHVAVIEWLNENTPLDMRWYLFKIEAVKIGNSPVSPLFTAVVAPSQEIKILGSEKRELAQRHEKRIRFWDGLLQVMNKYTNHYKNVSPSKDNWLSSATGVGGVYYQIIIRMENASLQLVIERSKNAEINKKIFDYLYLKKETIENEFGDQIIWRRMDDNISSRIQYDISECGLKDESTWEKYYEIIAKKFVDWDKAFKKHVKDIQKMTFETEE